MESELHTQFAALAHPQRLGLFRLLMRRYPDAVPAGEISQAIDVKPNTASVYLATLREAGLIDQNRVGTSLRYRATLPAVRKLADGLLGACCLNRPDICGLAATTGKGHLMPAQTRPLNVLFLCTGNSARSIMAEAILQAEGEGRFAAYSAGTRPSGAPNAEVLKLLVAEGYDTGPLRSKDIDEFTGPAAPVMDFVFTVCDHAANEMCPTWPGQPLSAHWGVQDPVHARGSAAERHLVLTETYRMLRNRIRAFASLRFETLDRISLQHRLDDIGGDATAKA